MSKKVKVINEEALKNIKENNFSLNCDTNCDTYCDINCTSDINPPSGGCIPSSC